MSEYSAVAEVSRLLRARLHDAFMDEPQLAAVFGAGGVVSSETPKEMESGTPVKHGLSVWLYAIERNEFLNNRPVERIDPTHMLRAPLPLNLHYLLTPISDDPETEQLIMGKLLQVLHEDPFLAPDPAHPELSERVRSSLENPNLETLARVWTALQAPYRLCTSYLVQVVDVQSPVPVASAPVLEQLSTYEQVLSVS
jgi:hypothetical protein